MGKDVLNKGHSGDESVYTTKKGYAKGHYQTGAFKKAGHQVGGTKSPLKSNGGHRIGGKKK